MRTLDDRQVEDIARRHETARHTLKPIRRITAEYPDMTLDDAYACQRAWVDLQCANGSRIIGRKIGLTSRAMQQAMSIDDPDFGTLLDYMAFADGQALDTSRFLDPKIEVELAFVLEDTVAADRAIEAHAIRDRIAYVVPALELIDARSYRRDPNDGVTRTVRDTIADNAANAGIVLGERQFAPGDLDLPWVGAVCRRNGIVEETGLAAGILGDPLSGVAWLARRFAAHGVDLCAGEVVLAGSFTRPVDCRPGDMFDVDFGDLGHIRLEFQ